MGKKTFRALICTAMVLLLATPINLTGAKEEAAINSADDLQKPESLTIVLPPEKNFFEQRRRYKYITDFLSSRLGIAVQTKILCTYGGVSEAFLEGGADAGFMGSFSYVQTHSLAGIEPIVRPVWRNGSSSYTGYIFVRKDSGIKTVDDMKGKRLVLVDMATTAGYIFQRAYFKEHGVGDMEKYFSKVFFAGSHDASAWAVYKGEADIGGGKNHIFNSLCEEFPDFKEQMVVLAEAHAVPSNGLAVRKDLPPALKKQLKDLLLGLDKTKEGRRVLEGFGAQKFIETGDEDYAPLYEMIKSLNIDLNNFHAREHIAARRSF